MKIHIFLRHYYITAFFLLMLPAVVQAQFIFTTNNGSITITGYTGPGGVVAIPGATNGHPVTAIGEGAFSYCTNVTSIVITNSITNIGADAFLGCASLTNISVSTGNPSYSSITNVLFDKLQDTLIDYPAGLTNGTYAIPDSVTSIGPYAFASCSSLTNIFMGVNSIGEFAFFECTGLASVTILTQYHSYVGTGTINIGAEAFFGCANLTDVVMANNVTNIGDLAFADCTSLAGIIIPDDDDNIGNLAFGDCTNLMSAYFPSNAPPNNGTAFSGDPGAVVYYVPGTTGWDATFGGAPTMEETSPSEFEYETDYSSFTTTITGYTGPGGVVVIPGVINGYPVTSIGSQAFQSKNVTEVTIPDGVTNIGQDAFFECTGLTKVVIPGSVTSIGQNAFDSCTSLTGVTIPNGVTSIGQATFFFCTNLMSIAIPSSVTSIGVDAFYNCAGLTSVTIGTNVTNIGQSAFEYCSGLTRVTIPASVTNIGVEAFYECTGLSSISVNAANPAYSSLNGVLFDKARDTLIDYPAGLTNGTYIVPNSVARVGEYAFAYCASLTSAYFQGNAPVDLGSAFYVCPATVYYLPGTTGWGAMFSDAPTKLWFQPQPAVLSFEPSFGVRNGQFGFLISWATNASVMVQASTNLANPAWIPVATNALSNGTNYFSDAQWMNYPIRFYRVSGP